MKIDCVVSNLTLRSVKFDYEKKTNNRALARANAGFLPNSHESFSLMNLHRAEPAAGGNRVPGGAGALPCGPLWPWTTPLPTQGGTAALRAVPGSAHRRRCRDRRLRWTKPAACPRSGCLAFEKLNPGERGGARRRAWTTASGCPPPPPSHPCPEPLRLGGRGSRGPVREGAPGGAALGVWGCKPPAWERPRRGGDRASEARRGLWTPPLGAIYAGRRGAAPAHETFRSLVC